MDRHRLIVMLALVGLGVATASAQVPVAERVVSIDRYPPARVTFPGGVTGLPDLTYSVVSAYRRLKLDLYLPPGPATGARPAVMYIHGGGWVGGSPRNAGAFENWPEVLASVAARGYVVASISYRLAGEAPFPAALHDAKTAIRWLRTNAATYGIDATRIVVWGSSAGGQLAGLVATTCGVAGLAPPVSGGRGSLPAAPPAPQPSDCVQGAVLWYAASEFDSKGAGPGGYLGCTPPNCTAQAKAASVATYVDASDPPFLLIHGSADSTVPVGQSQRLHAALQANGVRSELVVYPDIEHSYLGKTPQLTRETSRAGLDKSIAFVEATIGPKRDSR